MPATPPKIYQRTLNPWLVALALAMGAWVCSNLAWIPLQPRISFLFVAAVGVTAYYGGSLPGLVAVALNFGGEYALRRVHGDGFRSLPQELWEAGLMLLAASALGYAGDRTHHAEEYALGIAGDLRSAREELSVQRADLNQFHKASARLTSSLELPALFREIVSFVTALHEADACVLLLRPPADSTPSGMQDALRVATQTHLDPAQIERLDSMESSCFPLNRRMVLEDADRGVTMFPARAAAIKLGFRALISTPIVGRDGSPLGLVVACFSDPRRPSEREIQTMDFYAVQAANAIENARTYGNSVSVMQQEQRRAAVLRSLSEASVQINSTTSLDSLLQAITERARQIVGAHQAFTTLAPRGNWAQSINCISLSPEYEPLGKQAPEGSEMFVLACSLNKPVLVTAETQKNQPWWYAAGMDGSSLGANGWVAAPLLTRDGRNLGLIQLSSKIKGEFNEEDKSILVQLAQMASVAVENVRLYREAQEQIAERGRAQEALQRSQESLHLAQRAAGIGVFEWDLQHGMISWSDEIARLHGLQPQEFDGKYDTWIRTIQEEDRDDVHKAVARAIAGTTEYEVQYRVQQDGLTHWIEARGQAFSTSGTPVLVIGVAMDITARKQAEEALRRSEKLAATGRLAATIAHEVNNPLAAVTNLLFLLRTHRTLDDEARRYVASAEAELGRVTHITRQTLGFYRDATHPVETDVRAMLDELLGLYAKQINRAGIIVTRRYAFEGTILAFQNELRQVFSNLILNAIEALPADNGGRIALRVSQARKPDGTAGVRITVADNGGGIRLENRERIFEPFFTTKGQKGTGLGLWVSQGIIHKHGGTVRVRNIRSESPQGSCFSVFLPLEYVKAAEPTEPVDAAAA